MEGNSSMMIKTDCIHFLGYIPCKPHKLHGYHCHSCPEYLHREGRILIIKLAAAGDVIRTTPVLEPLRKEYPSHRIAWLSKYPDLLPKIIDDPLSFSLESILWLRNTSFDLLINLDKDREACALAKEINADRKLGFILDDNGFCSPCDEGPAKDKFITGLFDDENKKNRLSYVEETMAMCGYEFRGEEYILDSPGTCVELDIPGTGPVIGLNTGCGSRWPSRLWPEEYWIRLIRLLLDQGNRVMLLGGPEEDEKNKRISELSSAYYPGFFSLEEFISIMDRCEVVVSAVTMAMHIAIGLKKKLVLFNNIFNPHEFELYGRGVILAPEQECTCFFKPRCTNTSFCMETLTPDTVLENITRLLSSK